MPRTRLLSSLLLAALLGAIAILVAGPAVAGTPTRVAIIDDSLGPGETPSLQLDANGYPVLSYAEQSGGELFLARCSDTRCEAPPAITSIDDTLFAANRSSLQLDASNLPVIAYESEAGGSNAIKVARCTTPDCSAPTIHVVEDPGGFYPSLELDAAGHPVISYYNSEDFGLKVAHCADPACANPAVISTIDLGGPFGGVPSLQLDENGYPVIAHRDDDGEDDYLAIAFCADANCAATPTRATINTEDYPESISLRLDPDGNPVISYYEGDDRDLKIARCSDPVCTVVDVATVDSEGDVGGHLSLELDALGHPVLSYQDRTNETLKVARCGDPGCNNASTTAIPSRGIAGAFTSLELDGQGLPVISSFGRDGVTVTFCGTAACDGPLEPKPPSAISVVPVDYVGDVGRGVSLALTAEGLPVMSYQSNGVGLKFAACADLTCAAEPSVTTIEPYVYGYNLSGPSMQLDANGYPVIAYVGNQFDPGPDVPNAALKLARCVDSNCLSPPTITTIENVRASYGSASLRLDEAGNAVIAYRSRDTSGTSLSVARCGNPNCTSPTIEQVEGVSDVSDLSMQLDASDFPVISVRSFAGSWALRLVRCHDAACGSSTLRTVDEGTTSRGEHNSLQLDADDNPVISYYDSQFNSDLKLAHCEDPTCTEVALTVVDSGPNADVGVFTSLQLDSDGNPVVSYAGFDIRGLRLAQCSDPACATSPRITAIGEDPLRGMQGAFTTSLQLDSSGAPVIGYRDAVLDDLVLARCSNATCDEQPPAEPADVMFAVSCLAENGRVDTNIVNHGDGAATYRIEFGSLSARERTVAPDDWWRMPITGRPDGDHLVTVKRDGLIISQQTVTVSCDSSPPVITDPEVRVVNACRGLGYLLFQLVNPTDTAKPYIIVFEGVPNRSTTAAPYGQSIRAVTGRPNGEYTVTITSAGALVTEQTVTVDC